MYVMNVIKIDFFIYYTLSQADWLFSGILKSCLNSISYKKKIINIFILYTLPLDFKDVNTQRTHVFQMNEKPVYNLERVDLKSKRYSSYIYNKYRSCSFNRFTFQYRSDMYSFTCSLFAFISQIYTKLFVHFCTICFTLRLKSSPRRTKRF